MKNQISTCLICKNRCYYCGHLLNKEVYHIYCYQRILKNVKNLETEILSVEEKIDFLNQKLQKANLFRSSFRRIVLQKFENLGSLQPRIQYLERDKKDLIDSKIIYDNIIKHLYDYWPALPPDWAERCRQTLISQKKCHLCKREADNFYVTHKVPISKGGNHKIENLILLCKMCASVYTLNTHQVKNASSYNLSA